MVLMRASSASRRRLGIFVSKPSTTSRTFGSRSVIIIACPLTIASAPGGGAVTAVFCGVAAGLAGGVALGVGLCPALGREVCAVARDAKRNRPNMAAQTRFRYFIKTLFLIRVQPGHSRTGKMI